MGNCSFMWTIGLAVSLTTMLTLFQESSSMAEQPFRAATEQPQKSRPNANLTKAAPMENRNTAVLGGVFVGNQRLSGVVLLTMVGRNTPHKNGAINTNVKQRYRRKKEEIDGDAKISNVSEAKNGNVSSNATLVADGNNSKESAISDMGIIVIVVSTSIGLVICLLIAAFVINKCYWGKTREENAGYQGVLQKGTPDGNSPIDEQTTSMPSKQDNGIRGQTNVFAQIDEIDEADSCPESPVGKHQRRVSSSGPKGTEDGETKPLLTQCVTTPTSNMDDSDSKVSEADVIDASNDNLSSETEKETQNSEPDDKRTSSVTDVRRPPRTKVQVEIVPSPSNTPETERHYCRTGLSQSDYSISSFTSVNPSYRYGNQVGYMSGYYGYPCEEMGSPATDCYFSVADDVLLLPPSISGYTFPSQESDLDISVRAAKDSEESDDMTTDVISGEGLLPLPINSSTLTMNTGSEFSIGVNADDGDVGNCRESGDGDEVTGNDEFAVPEIEDVSDVTIDNSFVAAEESKVGSNVKANSTDPVDIVPLVKIVCEDTNGTVVSVTGTQNTPQ